MADLNTINRDIVIKKHQRDKLVAQSQILMREIRIEELKDEIGRCNDDIEAQNKVIAAAEFNINQQIQEKTKEAAAKQVNSNK
jgi:hypothetical protein